MSLPAENSPAGDIHWQFRGMALADLAVCDEAASFLQSGFWGSFKARFGWNARPFLITLESSGADQRGCIELPLLVIRRRLALGVSFAYVPWGPELPQDFGLGDTEKNRLLLELARGLRSLLPGNTAFIRFEPSWYAQGEEAAPSISAPFRRAAAVVQPPDTVVVDLSPPEEEILKQMKPKCRYNIGLANRRGVTVRSAGAEGIETFYSLYQETAKRDGISIHHISYYKTLFAHCDEYPRTGCPRELRLYLAEYEERPLGAVIVLFRGAEATYLYGASSNEKRNLMATYALQWKAMTDAKAAGCTRYDLFGIPPRPDPNHPMNGLYPFKTGFGGRIIHRPGTWDYSYKPLIRNVFAAAESLRKGVRSLRKKRCGRESQ